MIVMTANHYLLDALGGFVVLGSAISWPARFTACRDAGPGGPGTGTGRDG